MTLHKGGEIVNSSSNLYPLELSRVFVDKVWGRRDLGWALGTELRHLPTIGELWETFDGQEAGSLVLNGSHRLKPFREIVKELGADLLGTRLAQHSDQPFPLLIKYLFPSEPLSVQVHPDDDYASVHEGCRGKTEMWIVLHTEPGSFIILGWKPGLDKDRILNIIEIGDYEQVLNVITPRNGDVYFISPGTVHALGPGVSVLEIQQNSDITYRLFDWNRVGTDGSPRELHLQKALDVLDFNYAKDYRIEPIGFDIDGNELRYLCACRHFAVCELNLSGPLDLTSDPSCVWVLNVISGTGRIRAPEGEPVPLSTGATIAIPARMGEFVLEVDEPLRIVKSWVPDLKTDIINALRSRGVDDSRIVSLGGVGLANDIRELIL